MTVDDLIAECASDLSKIGESIASQPSGVKTYRHYSREFIKSYMEFADILKIRFLDMPGALYDGETISKRIVKCEIKAFYSYTHFQEYLINRSLGHQILKFKNFILRNSSYAMKLYEIGEIQKELMHPLLQEESEEILKKLKSLSQKYEELQKERLIESWPEFLAVIGILLGILNALKAFGLI